MPQAHEGPLAAILVPLIAKQCQTFRKQRFGLRWFAPHERQMSQVAEGPGDSLRNVLFPTERQALLEPGLRLRQLTALQCNPAKPTLCRGGVRPVAQALGDCT